MCSSFDFKFVDLTVIADANIRSDHVQVISLLGDDEDVKHPAKPGKTKEEQEEKPRKKPRKKSIMQTISLLDDVDDNEDALEVERFNMSIALALKRKAEKMWKLCDEEQIACAPQKLRQHILRRAMDSIKVYPSKLSAANLKRVRFVGKAFRHMVRSIL
jgi:hypothetical protein